MGGQATQVGTCGHSTPKLYRGLCKNCYNYAYVRNMTSLHTSAKNRIQHIIDEIEFGTVRTLADARLLNIKPQSLKRVLNRAGRGDLLDQLRRR